MHARHPGERDREGVREGEGGRGCKQLLAYIRVPLWERGASLILFESAFCHVLYRSTNKTRVLD